MKYTVQDDEFLTQGAKRTSNPLSYMVILCPCDAIWQIDFFFFFLNITALHVVLFFNFWWVIPNCIKIRIYIYIYTHKSSRTKSKVQWIYEIPHIWWSTLIPRYTTEMRPNKMRFQSLYRQLLPLKSHPKMQNRNKTQQKENSISLQTTLAPQKSSCRFPIPLILPHQPWRNHIQ